MSNECVANAVMTYGAFLAELDPFRAMREEQALRQFRDEDKWGPKRPKKKRGDIWIMVGTVLGMAGGGILGYSVNPVMAVLGVVGGGVVGALVGSAAAALTRKR